MDEAEDAESSSTRCLICSAQATGFHFEAQSCSACAAFFRRTIALNKTFGCITGRDECRVHYSMHQICRCCRFKKCLEKGMKPCGVQPKRAANETGRAFFTKSGLKRNKKFSLVEPLNTNERLQMTSSIKLTIPKIEAEDVSTEEEEHLTRKRHKLSSPSSPSTISTPPTTINNSPNVLSWLIKEEMKLGERRRIMFCERPVEKLLGQNDKCPYTKEDIKPLSFRAFRKSIRTHILLIYEWLQAWPDYQELDNNDKVSFLRKCVLFHTILDPVFISIQIGYPDKFVMQNGGYVSCLENCNEGWEDEKEISGRTKRLIYQPLLKRIMEEIIPPMIELNLSFEEFVALKALVFLFRRHAHILVVEKRNARYLPNNNNSSHPPIYQSIPNVSVLKRDVMRKQLDAIMMSLHEHYTQIGNTSVAERLGSIILLLSNIFSTGLDFVVSHRQIEFFDLWNLDSLLLQLLNLDTILEESEQRNEEGDGEEADDDNDDDDDDDG